VFKSLKLIADNLGSISSSLKFIDERLYQIRDAIKNADNGQKVANQNRMRAEFKVDHLCEILAQYGYPNGLGQEYGSPYAAWQSYLGEVFTGDRAFYRSSLPTVGKLKLDETLPKYERDTITSKLSDSLEKIADVEEAKVTIVDKKDRD
jgi:hypothetical protein